MSKEEDVKLYDDLEYNAYFDKATDIVHDWYKKKSNNKEVNHLIKCLCVIQSYNSKLRNNLRELQHIENQNKQELRNISLKLIKQLK